MGSVLATETPGQFLVTARPPGEDRISVRRYDALRKRYLDPISSDPVLDVERVVASNRKYIGAVYLDGRRKFDFADEMMTKHIRGLNAFVGTENEIELLGTARNGQVMLLLAFGPQNPGTVYVYDSAKRSAEMIANLSADLSPAQLGHTEIIDHTTRDGQALKSYLTHAVGKSPAPTLVLVHGGPESRYRYGFDPLVQFFAARGYNVFQPGFRGSSGYGKAYAESGYGQWGRRMQDDVSDGVRHLIDTDRARAGQIAIMGFSYGGYAAAVGLAKTPDLYQCAVAANGVMDLRDMLS